MSLILDLVVGLSLIAGVLVMVIPGTPAITKLLVVIVSVTVSVGLTIVNMRRDRREERRRASKHGAYWVVSKKER